MNDILILVSEVLLAQPADPASLLAFVKLQATHRAVWLRYRHDTALWRRLNDALPKWSLPEHMGLRRRVITGIKLLHGRCIACNGPAPRVFMAFQARICRACARRLLVSDFELAWTYGVLDPHAPYLVRYIRNVRVRFFMKQHLNVPRQPADLSEPQARECMRRWPGISRDHVAAIRIG